MLVTKVITQLKLKIIKHKLPSDPTDNINILSARAFVASDVAIVLAFLIRGTFYSIAVNILLMICKIRKNAIIKCNW